MTTREYFAGLWTAQEARRAGRSRAENAAYHAAGSARWQAGGAVVDTDPRVAPQATLLELRSLAFVLPLPPSVNALYGQAANGAKFLLPEQRQFRSAVIGIVRGVMRGADQIAQPLAGRLEVRSTYYFANRRRTDISNREKALLDALERAGAYHDDSQIDRHVIERVIRQGEESCSVTIQEIAA